MTIRQTRGRKPLLKTSLRTRSLSPSDSPAALSRTVESFQPISAMLRGTFLPGDSGNTVQRVGARVRARACLRSKRASFSQTRQALGVFRNAQSAACAANAQAATERTSDNQSRVGITLVGSVGKAPPQAQGNLSTRPARSATVVSQKFVSLVVCCPGPLQLWDGAGYRDTTPRDQYYRDSTLA